MPEKCGGDFGCQKTKLFRSASDPDPFKGNSCTPFETYKNSLCLSKLKF